MEITDPETGQLPWLIKAKGEYQRPGGISNTETSFFRGNRTIEIIDQLKERSHLRILLVGLGLTADPLLCCYAPFVIGAHLEGKGVDYSMTLIDNNRTVIDEVRDRKNLFLALPEEPSESRLRLQKAWEKYLRDTGQTGSITTQPEEGLNFLSYLKHRGWGKIGLSYRLLLGRGILVAHIPPRFQEKRENGNVQLINEDIATINPANLGLFDYAECVNVLHLMSKEGQQLAIANVAQALASEGIMRINDLGDRIGQPVSSALGGWLTPEKIRDLGLEIETRIHTKIADSREILLRKN